MEIYTFAEKRSLLTEYKLPDWSDYDSYKLDRDAVMGFIKPDNPVITQREADGYRRPSSYSCPAYSLALGENQRFLAYSLSGRGFTGNMEWRISGDGFADIGRGAEFPVSVPNVNALRSKLLNNVRSEVLDVAMVVAEMQSTVNTIVNGLARIGRSLAAVQRDNPRHFSYLLTGRLKDNRRPTDKFLRESSGVYLEWKYGIMPSVYDVASACKAMDMNEDGSFWDNPPLLVGRASEVVESSINVKPFIRDASGDGERVSLSLPARAEYKARIDYSIRGEALRGLNRYGVGLSSIPTVLYDKTPFSFVLDMALPISELIKAWTALSGCVVRGYCETLHKRVAFPKDTTNILVRGIPCTVSFSELPDWTSWKRNSFPSVPMPVPYVRNPIKTGNLATVLALFTQLRKKDNQK